VSDATTPSPDFEALLRQAFAPVDPPASLSLEIEARLTKLSEAAWEELEHWELEALTDPRNWTRLARPVGAGAIAVGAGVGLVLLRARREAKKSAMDKLLKR
jgi:hypothetical protein